MASSVPPVSLRYPLRKIDSADDYLEIRVVKYAPPDFSTNTDNDLNVISSSDALKTKGNIENPLAYIYLPMPQGISDSSSVGWGDDSLDTAAAFGAKQATNILKSADITKGIGDAGGNIWKALDQVASSGVAQQKVATTVASSLVNSLGGNTSPEGLLSRATGKVMNPHMELLFKSVTLRSFPFSFDFAPRDDKEAYQIKQIIRTFKRSMAAKSSGGGGTANIFISAPDIFQLTFKTGKNNHPFLNKFKPMALTNMSVNYAASGAYSTYEDATPVHMQMTLQFQELNPIYAEDYNDLTDNDGVGY
jgi:hypothetical protein